MANPNFNPEYSSNSVWYGTDMEECLTDYIDDMKSDINSLQSSKADINHTHTEYAPINHSHPGYAAASHTHSYNDLTDKPTIPAAPEYEFKSFNCNNILNGPLYMKRYGNVITLNSNGLLNKSLPMTSGGTIVTLPEQYRPNMIYRFPVMTGSWTGTITIQATGDVELGIISGRIENMALALFSCTYVI